MNSYLHPFALVLQQAAILLKMTGAFQLTSIEWGKVFMPETSLLEIFIRGSIIYLTLFLLLRVTLKRESGSVSITDMLVIVLLADAAQNAMAGGYNSIADGILLVVTIIFWSYFLNWLSYKIPLVRRIVRPRPLLLIHNGIFLEKNMKKELITASELKTILREQGIAKISSVKKAYMEPDGHVSILLHSGSMHKPTAGSD